MNIKSLAVRLSEWLPESVRFEQSAAAVRHEIAVKWADLAAFPSDIGAWQAFLADTYSLSIAAIPIDGLGLIQHLEWQKRHVFFVESGAKSLKSLQKYAEQQNIEAYTLVHNHSAERVQLYRIDPKNGIAQSTIIDIENLQKEAKNALQDSENSLNHYIEAFAPRTLWLYDDQITARLMAELGYILGNNAAPHRYSLRGQIAFTLAQETHPRDYAALTAAYGSDKTDRTEGAIQWLTTLWTSRFLFLKMLENQIARYNQHDDEPERYRFLHANWRIKIDYEAEEISFLESHTFAFWQVFMKEVAHTPVNERHGEWKTMFSSVPYLNANIFEPTAIEKASISMDFLSDEAGLEPFSESILETENKGKSSFIVYFLHLMQKIEVTEIDINTNYLQLPRRYSLPPNMLMECIEQHSGGTYFSANDAQFLYDKLDTTLPIHLPAASSGRLIHAALRMLLRAAPLYLRANKQQKQPPQYGLSDDMMHVILKNGKKMSYNITVNSGLRRLPSVQTVQEAIFDAIHRIVQTKITYSNELPHLNWLAQYHIYTFSIPFLAYKQGNNTQIDPFYFDFNTAPIGNILYERQLTEHEINQNSRLDQQIQRLKKIHYQTYRTPTLLPLAHNNRDESRLLERISSLEENRIPIPEQSALASAPLPLEPTHILLLTPRQTPLFAQSNAFFAAAYKSKNLSAKYVEHLIGRKEIENASILLPTDDIKTADILYLERLAHTNNKQLFQKNTIKHNKILFLEVSKKKD